MYDLLQAWQAEQSKLTSAGLVCHVHTDVEPMEMMRIDAQYRRRGDGLITQTVRQHEDPQPRGEDVAWARGLHTEMLARD